MKPCHTNRMEISGYYIKLTNRYFGMQFPLHIIKLSQKTDWLHLLLFIPKIQLDMEYPNSVAIQVLYMTKVFLHSQPIMLGFISSMWVVSLMSIYDEDWPVYANFGCAINQSQVFLKLKVLDLSKNPNIQAHSARPDPNPLPYPYQVCASTSLNLTSIPLQRCSLYHTGSPMPWYTYTLVTLHIAIHHSLTNQTATTAPSQIDASRPTQSLLTSHNVQIHRHTCDIWRPWILT